MSARQDVGFGVLVRKSVAQQKFSKFNDLFRIAAKAPWARSRWADFYLGKYRILPPWH